MTNTKLALWPSAKGDGLGWKPGWFDVLDREPKIKAIVDELLKSMDYNTWANTQEMSVGANRPLEFPTHDPECTALRLAMFHSAAYNRAQALNAARFVFQIGGKGPNDIVPQLLRAHFDPLVHDLKSLILARLRDAPAADNPIQWREEVVLDPNASGVIDLRNKIAELLDLLQKINDRPEPEIFNQRLHEVCAGRELLRSNRVRGGLFGETVDLPLRWFGSQLANLPSGVLANAVYALILLHFGQH